MLAAGSWGASSTIARTWVGNRRGVGESDPPAVAEPEVVDLLLTERNTDGLDVSGDVGGSDVGREFVGEAS